MTLSLSLLFWSALAADPTPDPLAKNCDPQDPTSCVQYLRAGELAEFSGPQMTPRRAAKLGVRAETCQAQIDLSVAETTKLLHVDLDLLKALRASDKDAHEVEKGILTRALQESTEDAERRWHEHPLLWTGVGVVVTAVAIGVATAIISETRPSIVTP